MVVEEKGRVVDGSEDEGGKGTGLFILRSSRDNFESLPKSGHCIRAKILFHDLVTLVTSPFLKVIKNTGMVQPKRSTSGSHVGANFQKSSDRGETCCCSHPSFAHLNVPNTMLS